MDAYMPVNLVGFHRISFSRIGERGTQKSCFKGPVAKLGNAPMARERIGYTG